MIIHELYIGGLGGGFGGGSLVVVAPVVGAVIVILKSVIPLAVIKMPSADIVLPLPVLLTVICRHCQCRCCVLSLLSSPPFADLLIVTSLAL